MDDPAAGAIDGSLPVRRPWRRFALRAGAVLGFAAGVWILGTVTASAAPADEPPRIGGILTPMHDAADALLPPTAGDTSNASASAPSGVARIPVATSVAGPRVSAAHDVVTPVAESIETVTSTVRQSAPGRAPAVSAGAIDTAASTMPEIGRAAGVTGTIADSRMAPGQPLIRTLGFAADDAATVVLEVRDITGSAEPPDGHVVTAAAAAIGAIDAALDSVDQTLAGAGIADTIGWALATVDTIPGLPAADAVERLPLMRSLFDRDDSAAAVGTPRGRDIGFTDAVRTLDRPDRADSNEEAFGAQGSERCTDTRACVGVDGESDPGNQRTAAPDRILHVVPRDPAIAADIGRAPTPGQPVPLPAPPAGAPTSGEASAASHGYHGAAITAAIPAADLERCPGGGAHTRQIVPGDARDPGFSPG